MAITDLIQPFIDSYQAKIQSKLGYFYTQRDKIYQMKEKAIALGRVEGMSAVASEVSFKVGILLNKNADLQKEVDNMTGQLASLGDTTGKQITTFKFSLAKLSALGIQSLALITAFKTTLPALFTKIDQHVSDVNVVEARINGVIATANVDMSDFTSIIKRYGAWIIGGIAGLIAVNLMRKK